MLLEIIFSGVLAGLLLAFAALGPSFFTLIKIGIHQNFQKGALFASGILISDLIIVLLVYFGLSHIYDSHIFKAVFSLVGGVLVFIFGLKSLQEHKKAALHQLSSDIPDYQYVIEGFGLNILNPFTFGLWVFVVATVNQLRDYAPSEVFIFYATVLATVFSTDLFKTYIANQTGKGLSTLLLNRINNFIGVVLILLSFRLLYFFFTLITETS
jgi:threonine/homoserine/homoserine lactone efflux protein